MSAAEVVLVGLEDEAVGWGIKIPSEQTTRRHEPFLILPCDSCGHGYRVSARTQRDMAVEERPPVCPMCRRPAKIEITKAHCNYWLKRFTIEEIVAIAESIWGPRDTWKHTTV